MKNNNTEHHHIPDIEIIDLESADTSNGKAIDDNAMPDEALSGEELSGEELSDEAEAGNEVAPRGLRSFLNLHSLLLLVFVVFVVCIVIKFKNWGVRIDISDIEHDDFGTYLDVLDSIVPLTDDNGQIIQTAKADTIVVFGNAPFADDRDSEDNLANLIEQVTGATVYNCSISNSYLTSVMHTFDDSACAMDAYTFYWLACLAAPVDINNQYYARAAEALGENTPPEAQEVYDTLTSLNFNEVDAIAIMYDATDYLMGHAIYDGSNHTNIQQFTGNLEAGIEIFQNYYPHIRILVMSPTYAYAINENGDYVNSDMYVYGDTDVLSTYVIKQMDSCIYRNVTFIDNLYGTITENNAQDYLIDNLHLNVDGRKLVAQRFADALNKYNK